ncbi:hypothetical protein Tco_0761887 [Tanacetum coccineum]
MFSSGGALLLRRGVLLLILTNKCWVDGNGSNSGGGFGKPGGGLETLSGGDGLEGPGGQLSMVLTFKIIWLNVKWEEVPDPHGCQCVLLLEIDFDGACGGESDFPFYDGGEGSSFGCYLLDGFIAMKTIAMVLCDNMGEKCEENGC